MAQKINHLIVLMLENRSFDHMLGYLKQPGYAIDGLTGRESNPVDPAQPAQRVRVSKDAEYVLAPDAGHDFSDVNVQLFGNPAGPTNQGQPNEGFVYNYAQKSDPATGAAIMKCFDPARLPVLSTLARQFAVCDRWFSSVPGPTWPNRFFAHAATSKGYLDNRLHNYDMRSIFENLSDQGYTWGNYFHDASQTMFLQRLRADGLDENFLPFTRFVSDAKRGQLPNYSFIEPQYFSFLSEANDQHPPHDVQAGERLIATVYNAVRSSSLWKKSMLLVTYDEHGGTYDHVPPERATSPDGNTAQFAFDRYGVRVPAVVISPYVRKGYIEHRVFDHTSIPATLKSIFKLRSFLTRRDAAANAFASIASLSAPRTDVPSNVALPAARDRPAMDDELLGDNAAMKAKVAARTSTAPLTDLQKALVSHAHTLEVDETPQLRSLRMARRVETEYDAAVYVREVTARYLAKKSSGSSGTARPQAQGTPLKEEAVPRKTRRASKTKRVVKKATRKR